MASASRSLSTDYRELIDSRVRSRRAVTVREWFIKGFLIFCAAFSIFITFTFIVVLFREAGRFFARDEVTIANFFFSTDWSPEAERNPSFGIWPLISGTMSVTFVAMLLALPLGLVTAVYLSEYATKNVRSALKPTLEVLAGIPTVVYGYFALTIITPSLKLLHSGFEPYNILSAGIAVGILCFPTVCSLTEDALQAVPRGLRDGAHGLGATRFDVSTRVVVPAALSGIISAFLLAVARAIGETMIVALAAGVRANLTIDPREPAQTMTGFMVHVAYGESSHEDTSYFAMYAVGITLFLITFTLTVIGNIVRKRFREIYE